MRIGRDSDPESNRFLFLPRDLLTDMPKAKLKRVSYKSFALAGLFLAVMVVAIYYFAGSFEVIVGHSLWTQVAIVLAVVAATYVLVFLPVSLLTAGLINRTWMDRTRSLPQTGENVSTSGDAK